MDNVNALKAVYVALGGDAADVAGIASNPDMIKALAALINNNGISTLPDPSEANDGDVLTVADGEWTAATPSGGGAMIVTLTEDDQSNWSSDKTFAQIKAAVEGGQAVSALVYSGTDLICIAPLTWFDFSEGNGMVTFCAMTINQSNNRLGALYYYVEEDNSVTATPLYYTLTPSE